MAYKMDSFKLVSERFEERRRRAEQDAEMRRLEVQEKHPEIRAIDEALASTGMRIFRTACAGGENVRERVGEIRRENEQLLEERRALLKTLGYAEDYTDIRYACRTCGDTGFVECRMCECMRRELVIEGFRSSGLGRLIDRQSFDNFSLDYYRASKEDYERMETNLEAAREFAESTPPRYANLLLFGGTGLGKTHLSTAIARRVIERGYEVRYETVQNIIDDFAHDQFRSDGKSFEDRGRVYLEAELLIIDDLGTEMTNSFTVSALYRLINTRINNGLSTVINTNLEQKEIRTRYTDRVASRIFGEYRPIFFKGKDVRFQQLFD